MNVCLVQTDMTWGDVQGNLGRLESALASAPEAGLYLLPEMFTTGFATLPDAVVEEEPSEGLEWMKSCARRLDAALCGSIALRLRDGGSCLNRMYFVTPDGRAEFYDKRHLFGYGGEKLRFSAGSGRVVVSYGGVRFLLAVCYDLRFPVWLRNRGDYDVMLLAANWPRKRRNAWDLLTRARAVENQCYVLAVNRVGSDPACVYDGGTVALGPAGEVLAEVPDGVEGCCCAELDMSLLQACRREFPVLDDADAFRLEL